MTESDRGGADVVVMPLRFTDDVPRMREFLALLGFSARVTRADTWAVMAGASGTVALHAAAISADASAAETELAFEVDDADALAARLTRAGFADVAIHDEAYGRVVTVPDREGKSLTFDERSTDFYGYQVEDPRPSHGVVSMPVRFDAPTSSIATLLATAGFERLDEGDDEWWRVWRGRGGGLVALHPPTGDKTPGSVQLAFRTREPLADLAARLTSSGHHDVAVSKERGGELTVTDPDGETVLVQPVPTG